MIPKVKACIEKKNPTHFLSPERMLELERINIQKQREFVSKRRTFLEFNPKIQTGEVNESFFRDPPRRSTVYHETAYAFSTLNSLGAHTDQKQENTQAI